MATIENLLDAVRTYMKSVDDGEAEVRIFDQASTDGTANFLRQTQNDTPHGTIMLSMCNLGQSLWFPAVFGGIRTGAGEACPP
jgi:predicted RNA binding protein with dsRBD fold (UPF0201 family)